MPRESRHERRHQRIGDAEAALLAKVLDLQADFLRAEQAALDAEGLQLADRNFPKQARERYQQVIDSRYRNTMSPF
jgi:hypothetical protein